MIEREQGDNYEIANEHSQIQYVLAKMDEMSRRIILAEGGNVESLVFALSVSLHKKTETQDETRIEPVHGIQPVNFVFQYTNDEIDEIIKDSDCRIGETVFQIVRLFMSNLASTVREWKRTMGGQRNGS